jgi:hypothetical protein
MLSYLNPPVTNAQPKISIPNETKVIGSKIWLLEKDVRTAKQPIPTPPNHMNIRPKQMGVTASSY